MRNLVEFTKSSNRVVLLDGAAAVLEPVSGKSDTKFSDEGEKSAHHIVSSLIRWSTLSGGKELDLERDIFVMVDSGDDDLLFSLPRLVFLIEEMGDLPDQIDLIPISRDDGLKMKILRLKRGEKVGFLAPLVFDEEEVQK